MRIGKPSPNKGKKMSEEQKEKLSISHTGKKLSDLHKEKIKDWMLENNPFKGKKHTEESKRKILSKHPSKIKVTCENCSRELDLPNYKRYHGDKCSKIIKGFS